MKTKFIIFIVAVILIIGGLGIFISKSNSGSSKFDDFAKALKDRGTVFYGAFWCPHCQAQKAEFGSSKQYLPYVECSNADNSQKQICVDNKIEAYPTWTFKDGIKLTSANEPTICPINIEGVTQTDICKYAASSFYRVWIFPEYTFSVKSPADPTRDGNVWQFPAGTQAVGEISQEFLAEQIQFTLPK